MKSNISVIVPSNVKSTMLVQGILLILMAIMILIWPEATLLNTYFIMGVFFLLLGIFDFLMGIMNVFTYGPWGLKMLSGILAFLVGSLMLKHPVGFSEFIFFAMGLLFVIKAFSFFAIFNAISNSAIRVNAMVLGVLNLLIGLFLFMSPWDTGTAMFWFFGLYCIIAGTMSVALAMQFKKIGS